MRSFRSFAALPLALVIALCAGIVPAQVAPPVQVPHPVQVPPPAQVAPQGADADGPAVIYVVRRGWHIDVGFAAHDLQLPLKSLTQEFPGVRYLIFGFGDRRYLLAKDRNAPVLLAALWPGHGLILATGLSATPQEAFGASHVAALTVTLGQARAAQAFVWQSLQKQASDTDQDSVKPYADGPYEGSLYFATPLKYSALHTCNTWAAESLQAAALPVHGAGVVFAGQLWNQVRRLEGVATHPAISQF